VINTKLKEVENKLILAKTISIPHNTTLLEEDGIDDYTHDNIQNIPLLMKELNDLKREIEVPEKQMELLKNAEIKAKDFVIEKRNEKLKNSFVMENTPLGNVLMVYDLSRNSFKYYSDNTIPYRYLEVVARKYVKMFDCRPIYVDMEEELNTAEEKWREKEETAKLRENDINTLSENKTNHLLQDKKNVFAKFKSYNKEGSTGRVNTVAPPKNSIPNKNTSVNEKEENKKILLKDKANVYTHDGKLSNFSFLKKIDRKIVDKKYGLTFADFKRMFKI